MFVQVLDDFTLRAGVFLRPLKVVMVHLCGPAHYLFGIAREWKGRCLVFTLRFLSSRMRAWLRCGSGWTLRRWRFLRCTQRSPQNHDHNQVNNLGWSFSHEICNV
jgi:hypothetical protein